jgi:hypothetical protein
MLAAAAAAAFAARLPVTLPSVDPGLAAFSWLNPLNLLLMGG